MVGSTTKEDNKNHSFTFEALLRAALVFSFFIFMSILIKTLPTGPILLRNAFTCRNFVVCLNSKKVKLSLICFFKKIIVKEKINKSLSFFRLGPKIEMEFIVVTTTPLVNN